MVAGSYVPGSLIRRVTDDDLRAWLDLEDAVIIRKVDGEWQLPGDAWKVLNAAAAFGHPAGSIPLLNDLADALSLEQPT